MLADKTWAKLKYLRGPEIKKKRFCDLKFMPD